MPFKSKRQSRFMRWAESKGLVPKGTSHRWAHHTPGGVSSLPEKASQSTAPSCQEKVAAGGDFEPQSPPGYRPAGSEPSRCGTCLHFTGAAGTCNRFDVPVRADDTCDAWEPNKKSMGGLKFDMGALPSSPSGDSSSSFKFGAAQSLPMVPAPDPMRAPSGPVRPLQGVAFGQKAGPANPFLARLLGKKPQTPLTAVSQGQQQQTPPQGPFASLREQPPQALLKAAQGDVEDDGRPKSVWDLFKQAPDKLWGAAKAAPQLGGQYSRMYTNWADSNPNVSTALEAVPLLGTGLGAAKANEFSNRGDYVSAGGEGVGAALGLLPAGKVLGKLLGKGAGKIAPAALSVAGKQGLEQGAKSLIQSQSQDLMTNTLESGRFGKDDAKVPNPFGGPDFASGGGDRPSPGLPATAKPSGRMAAGLGSTKDIGPDAVQVADQASRASLDRWHALAQRNRNAQAAPSLSEAGRLAASRAEDAAFKQYMADNRASLASRQSGGLPRTPPVSQPGVAKGGGGAEAYNNTAGRAPRTMTERLAAEPVSPGAAKGTTTGMPTGAGKPSAAQSTPSGNPWLPQGLKNFSSQLGSGARQFASGSLEGANKPFLAGSSFLPGAGVPSGDKAPSLASGAPSLSSPVKTPQQGAAGMNKPAFVLSDLIAAWNREQDRLFEKQAGPIFRHVKTPQTVHPGLVGPPKMTTSPLNPTSPVVPTVGPVVYPPPPPLPPTTVKQLYLGGGRHTPPPLPIPAPVPPPPLPTPPPRSWGQPPMQAKPTAGLTLPAGAVTQTTPRSRALAKGLAGTGAVAAGGGMLTGLGLKAHDTYKGSTLHKSKDSEGSDSGGNSSGSGSGSGASGSGKGPQKGDGGPKVKTTSPEWYETYPGMAALAGGGVGLGALIHQLLADENDDDRGRKRAAAERGRMLLKAAGLRKSGDVGPVRVGGAPPSEKELRKRWVKDDSGIGSTTGGVGDWSTKPSGPVVVTTPPAASSTVPGRKGTDKEIGDSGGGDWSGLTDPGRSTAGSLADLAKSRGPSIRPVGDQPELIRAPKAEAPAHLSRPYTGVGDPGLTGAPTLDYVAGLSVPHVRAAVTGASEGIGALAKSLVAARQAAGKGTKPTVPPSTPPAVTPSAVTAPAVTAPVNSNRSTPLPMETEAGPPQPWEQTGPPKPGEPTKLPAWLIPALLAGGGGAAGYGTLAWMKNRAKKRKSRSRTLRELLVDHEDGAY